MRNDDWLLPATAVLFAVATLGASIVNWPLSSGAVVAAVAMVVSFASTAYLLGPSTYVRVGADEVVVANLARIHTFPPVAVAAVGGYDNLGVTITLTTGRRIDVTACEPLIRVASRSVRQYRRRGSRIESAVREAVGAAGGGRRDGHTTRWRWSTFLVAAFGIVAPVVVAVTWGLPHSG